MNKSILDIISDKTMFEDIQQELLKTQSIIGKSDEISKEYCYKVITSGKAYLIGGDLEKRENKIIREFTGVEYKILDIEI